MIMLVLAIALNWAHAQAAMRATPRLLPELLCSTWLSSQSEPVVFNIGAHGPNGTVYAQQAEGAPGPVSLEGNFAYFDMFSDMVLPFAAWENDDVADVRRLAIAEHRERSGDLLFGLNYGLMRGPVPTPLQALMNQDPRGRALERNLFDPIREMQRSLYTEYEGQGPERSDLLPLIREQDHSESEYFVRGIISRFIKPMGYWQILTSPGFPSNLHEYRAWPEKVRALILSRPPGSYGGLGRLHLVHPNNYPFEHYVQLVPKVVDQAEAQKATRIVGQILFQKMAAWVNSDARLDYLLMQVNLTVERRLRLSGFPLQFGERYLVEKPWSSGEMVTEALYLFNREALLKTEDLLFARVLRYWLSYFRDKRFFRTLGKPGVKLRFMPNEVAALRRLNLDFLFRRRWLPPPNHVPEIFEVGINFESVNDVILFLDAVIFRLEEQQRRIGHD